MNTKLDLISGELVMVNATLSPLATLKELNDRHNVNAYWQEVSPRSALKRALKEEFLNGGTVLIRDGAKERICVVTEDIDDHGNRYATTDQYGIDLLTWEAYHVADDERTERDCSAIQTLVDAWRGQVFGTRVATAISKLLLTRYGATRLRKQGAVYFVPSCHLEDWEKFADDFTTCTNNSVHRIQSGVDANTAQAVMESATEDLRTRYTGALDRLAEVTSDGSEASEKRAKVAKDKIRAELEEVKKIAQGVADSFGLTNELATEIENEYKVAIALALMTA